MPAEDAELCADAMAWCDLRSAPTAPNSNQESRRPRSPPLYAVGMVVASGE
jgi:hypothetical protein